MGAGASCTDDGQPCNAQAPEPSKPDNLVAKVTALQVENAELHKKVYKLSERLTRVEEYLNTNAPSESWAKTEAVKEEAPSAVALVTAARDGDVAALKKLVAEGVDVNSRDSNNATALYIAVAQDHTEAAQILLDHGANPNIVCFENRVALSVAVANENTAAVKMLLEAGADVQLPGSGELLLQACRNSQDEIIKLLIAAGAPVNTADYFGTTPLHYAMNGCSMEVVQLLLSKKPDVNAANKQKVTPLLMAGRHAIWQAVPLLLAAGADCNAMDELGETILIQAARNGDLPTVQCLLQHGAAVDIANNNGETALLQAARSDALPVVQALLAAGAPLTTRNANGATIMHIAAAQASAEMVRYLAAAGVDLNAVRTDGKTPLHMAVQQYQRENVQALLELGADPNIPDQLCKVPQSGRTPLLAMAYNSEDSSGMYDMYQLLLDGGADVNATDSTGATTLHYLAPKEGHDKIIELLLDKGADLNRVDRTANTPLDLARGQMRHEAVQMMLARRDKLMAARSAEAATADVFISFRVAEGLAEAKLLKQALAARNIPAFACEGISSGSDWADAISHALGRSSVFVILGTETYGMPNASGLLSTADELRYAKEKRVPISLAKMCESYKADLAQVTLPGLQHIIWEKGTPLPEALLNDIVQKLEAAKKAAQK